MTVQPLCVEFWYVAVTSVLSTTLKLWDWGFFWTQVMNSRSCQKCQLLQGDAAWLSKWSVCVRVSVCACFWSLVWLGAVWASAPSFPFLPTLMFQFNKVHLELIERWPLTKLCFAAIDASPSDLIYSVIFINSIYSISVIFVWWSLSV